MRKSYSTQILSPTIFSHTRTYRLSSIILGSIIILLWLPSPWAPDLFAAKCLETLKIPIKILYNKGSFRKKTINSIIDFVKKEKIEFRDQGHTYKVVFTLEAVEYDMHEYWKLYMKEIKKPASKISAMDSNSRWPLKKISHHINLQFQKYGKTLGAEKVCSVFGNHFSTLAKQAYFIKKNIPISQFGNEIPILAVIVPCGGYISEVFLKKEGIPGDFTIPTENLVTTLTEMRKRLQRTGNGLLVLKGSTVERDLQKNLPRPILMHNGERLVLRDVFEHKNTRELLFFLGQDSNHKKNFYHELMHYLGVQHNFEGASRISSIYNIPDIRMKSGRDKYCMHPEIIKQLGNSSKTNYFTDEDYKRGGVSDTVPAMADRGGTSLWEWVNYCQKKFFTTFPLPGNNYMGYAPLVGTRKWELTLDQKKVAYHFACHFLNP